MKAIYLLLLIIPFAGWSQYLDPIYRLNELDRATIVKQKIKEISYTRRFQTKQGKDSEAIYMVKRFDNAGLLSDSIEYGLYGDSYRYQYVYDAYKNREQINTFHNAEFHESYILKNVYADNKLVTTIIKDSSISNQKPKLKDSLYTILYSYDELNRLVKRQCFKKKEKRNVFYIFGSDDPMEIEIDTKEHEEFRYNKNGLQLDYWQIVPHHLKLAGVADSIEDTIEHKQYIYNRNSNMTMIVDSSSDEPDTTFYRYDKDGNNISIKGPYMYKSNNSPNETTREWYTAEYNYDEKRSLISEKITKLEEHKKQGFIDHNTEPYITAKVLYDTIDTLESTTIQVCYDKAGNKIADACIDVGKGRTTHVELQYAYKFW